LERGKMGGHFSENQGKKRTKKKTEGQGTRLQRKKEERRRKRGAPPPTSLLPPQELP